MSLFREKSCKGYSFDGIVLAFRNLDLERRRDEKP